MNARLLAGLLAGTVTLLPLTGCSAEVDGVATPVVEASPAAAVPEDVAGLGALVLTRVPGGLARVPDAELDPPAGPKTVQDVAGYSHDPDRDAGVLADYGYRWGWERFWRAEGRLTTVFVDQFDGVSGAASYADDLARNDIEYYGGNPDRAPAGLPAGCSLLSVDDPAEDTGLAGPSAFAWCAHGPFTVSVATVAQDPDAALSAVRAVVLAQLDRLPRR